MTVPTITLDTLTANTFDVDADGVEWIMDKPVGWDFAEVRVGVQPRPFADGSWVAPGWENGREVVLRGVAVCPDDAALEAARYRLAAVAALLRRSGLLVVGEAVPKQMTVRLLDRPDTSEDGTTLTFQVPLIAADPRKYGTTQRTASAGLTGGPAGGDTFPLTFPMSFGTVVPGGILQVTNDGDAPTSPVFQITGPVSDPVLQDNDSGVRFELDYDVAAGEVVTVDMAVRTVLSGGTASRRYAVVPGSEWFAFRPGGSGIRFSGAAYNSAASLTALWRDAW